MKIERRGFLKLIPGTVAAAAIALLVKPRRNLPSPGEGLPSGTTLLFDESRNFTKDAVALANRQNMNCTIQN